MVYIYGSGAVLYIHDDGKLIVCICIYCSDENERCDKGRSLMVWCECNVQKLKTQPNKKPWGVMNYLAELVCPEELIDSFQSVKSLI